MLDGLQHGLLPKQASTTDLDAHLPGTMRSDLIGVKPTDPDRYEDGRSREYRAVVNNRNNPIRSIRERMAGGRRKFYALSRQDRIEMSATAAQMYELGSDIILATAARAVDRRGFVYVITHPAFPGYVKIGRAFDPESRLRGYQTSCPCRDYELYAAVYFEDCHMAEQEIHARLADEQRNGALGEWFYITPFLARHEINKLRSII